MFMFMKLMRERHLSVIIRAQNLLNRTIPNVVYNLAEFESIPMLHGVVMSALIFERFNQNS